MKDGNTRLWVVDDRVAVFSVEQAKTVFFNYYDGLKVWAIKDDRAQMVNSVHDAMEFFEEPICGAV